MMRIVLLALAVLFGFAAAAQADTYKSVNDCKVGAHVVDNMNKPGVIVLVDDPNSLCQIRYDDGSKSYLLFWMLRSAGGGQQANGGGLVPGKYACWAGRNYIFMDITITGPGRYNTQGGGGTFHMGPNNAVVFDSGSLKPYRAILKEGPSIGLNSNGDSFYGTLCSLAR